MGQGGRSADRGEGLAVARGSEVLIQKGTRSGMVGRLERRFADILGEGAEVLQQGLGLVQLADRAKKPLPDAHGSTTILPVCVLAMKAVCAA